MKTLKQFQEATGYLKVKSPDEQKFIDKHEVEVKDDQNGNGDDVFKASKVKKVERKAERKGYEPGEDESVYEEVEELDELSNDTLRSYRMKAKSIADHGGEQRTKGRELAGRKSYGGRMAGIEKAKVMAKEEAEQIDELSGEKVKSYLRATSRTAKSPADSEKRKRGAAMAVRRLETEEVEQVDEMSSKMKMKLGLYGKKKKMTKEEADYLINRYADFKESIGGLAPRLQEAMHDVLDRLNEENQDVFMTSCQTEEGLEKMVAFAIENRGE